MTTGKDSQLGFVPEVTYGTRVVPTEFVRGKVFGFDPARELIVDDAILAGRLTEDTAAYNEGNLAVAGSVSLPLFRGVQQTLLKSMMGAEAGLGTLASPYLYTPADLPSMTMQIGAGGTAGVVHPFDYTGVVVSGWSIGAQVGGNATLDLDLVGQDADSTESLATASFSKPKVYSFAHASATIGGATRKVKSVTFAGDNGLGTDRRFLGSVLIQQPLADGLRSYTAEVVIEFEDIAEYTAYVAGIGSTVAVVAVFTDGTDILTITMNGYRDAAPVPQVDTRGALEVAVSVIATSTTDALACTIQQNTAS